MELLAPMQIYADFNGIDQKDDSSGECDMDLTGYGTLASLSTQQIKLREGMILQFFDDDGTTVKGTVYFDPKKITYNCSGWFARFHDDDISYDGPQEFDFQMHLCFSCRHNIKKYIESVGQNFTGTCPHCGTPIMYPLLPPENLGQQA